MISRALCEYQRWSCKPEIEIIQRPLLVAHVDKERKEVDGREGPTAQYLEQSRETVSRRSSHSWACGIRNVVVDEGPLKGRSSVEVLLGSSGSLGGR